MKLRTTNNKDHNIIEVLDNQDQVIHTTKTAKDFKGVTAIQEQGCVTEFQNWTSNLKKIKPVTITDPQTVVWLVTHEGRKLHPKTKLEVRDEAQDTPPFKSGGIVGPRDHDPERPAHVPSGETVIQGRDSVDMNKLRESAEQLTRAQGKLPKDIDETLGRMQKVIQGGQRAGLTVQVNHHQKKWLQKGPDKIRRRISEHSAILEQNKIRKATTDLEEIQEQCQAQIEVLENQIEILEQVHLRWDQMTPSQQMRVMSKLGGNLNPADHDQ